MAFDTQRAVVATGDGIVARFPGVLCVARCPDAAPVRQLLTLCADVAGADPGRELARRFATWLTGPDAPGDRLAFGTLAAAGEQLAVFLVGPVDARVDGPDGAALSGADAAIGTDRLLPRPSTPVVLSVGEVRLPPDAADVHDLRSGVVPGAAAVLHPPPARTDDAPDPTVGGSAWPADAPAWLTDVPRAAGDAGDPSDRPVERPEPAPDHDWFAARPEPPPTTSPPAVGPWDTSAWPDSPNGSAARLDGGSATVAVPAVTAGPWTAGRHAILEPAPAGPGDQPTTGLLGPGNGRAEPDRPDDLAEPGAPRPVDTLDPARTVTDRTDDAAGEPPASPSADAAGPGEHTPADAGDTGGGAHRPASAQDAAGLDTRPSSVTVDTGGFGPHRPADASTVGRPLPHRGEPDTPAGAAAPAGRARVPSPVPRSLPAPTGSGPVEVSGYLCEQGHLTDPRAPFCGQCGSSVDDRAGGLVSGTRPALGRLLFDDGAAYVVEDGLLVGRLPESDDRVRAGGLRPVIVDDPTGSVSRVHAEIQISGWDVMLLDAGSRNGTFVAGPEDSAWSPLPPERGRRLLPGTRVRLGGRTFVYESSSGLR